jgi:tripartite-type tricarboxylate transporter receptor subunit TctC
MRKIFAIALFALSFAALAADKFDPHRDTTTLYVGYGPGGANDQNARIVERYAAKKGVKLIVVNKPGADGIVANNHLQTLPADGNTLVVSGIIQTVFHGIQNQEGRTYVDSDFTPVVVLSEGYRVLIVNADTGITSWEELLTWAKANPTKINIGGIASGVDMEKEKMFAANGISATTVPYKSDTEAIQAVAAGNIAIGMPSYISLVQSMAATGKIRVIAVLGNKRVATSPNAISMAEVNAEYAKFPLRYVFTVLAKSGTSIEVVTFWNKFFNEAIKDAESIDLLKGQMLTPVGGTPSDAQEILTKNRTAVVNALKK